MTKLEKVEKFLRTKMESAQEEGWVITGASQTVLSETHTRNLDDNIHGVIWYRCKLCAIGSALLHGEIGTTIQDFAKYVNVSLFDIQNLEAGFEGWSDSENEWCLLGQQLRKDYDTP